MVGILPAAERSGDGRFDIRPAAPELFAGVEDDPIYGSFGRRYFPAIHASACVDHSFSVWKAGEPILLVECDAIGRRLARFGHPIRFFAAAHCNERTKRLAVRAAFARISDLLEREEVDCAVISALETKGQLDAVGIEAINRRSEPRLTIAMGSNLSLDESRLTAAIRKSYRSLVNWGRRNLTLTYVNAANPDRSAFEDYRGFHAAIAGRCTRSEDSWNVMFEFMVCGRGELTLGRDPSGALVSGTMIVDGERVAYYASGVYDRTRFEQPLGHWPLFDAILRAKRRGKSWLHLGEVPSEAHVPKKERDIAFFKRGFATEYRVNLVWTLRSERKRT